MTRIKDKIKKREQINKVKRSLVRALKYLIAVVILAAVGILTYIGLINEYFNYWSQYN